MNARTWRTIWATSTSGTLGHGHRHTGAFERGGIDTLFGMPRKNNLRTAEGHHRLASANAAMMNENTGFFGHCDHILRRLVNGQPPFAQSLTSVGAAVAEKQRTRKLWARYGLTGALYMPVAA